MFVVRFDRLERSGFRFTRRQSFFDDPDYRRYTVNGVPVDSDDGASYVLRDGTLNALISKWEVSSQW